MLIRGILIIEFGLIKMLYILNPKNFSYKEYGFFVNNKRY
jgi:hypothetical protein